MVLLLRYHYNPGSGYTSTNPPLVLIGPPARQTESCDVIQNTGYSGDSGIIVGLGTTSVGVGSTGLMFHLHIPLDSDMGILIWWNCHNHE